MSIWISIRWPAQRAALWRALPAVVWAAVIFAFSAQSDLPRVPQSLLDVLVKKGGHMAEYAVLVVLLHRALVPALVGRGRRAWLLAWLAAVAYALSDEVHQSFVPGRTAAALDVAIDGMGALIGLVALRLTCRPLKGASRRSGATPRAAGERPHPPDRARRSASSRRRLPAVDSDLGGPLYPGRPVRARRRAGSGRVE